MTQTLTAPAPDFVGVESLSHRSGLSRSTIYNRLDAGEIRSVRFGTRRLIPAEEADRFIKGLREQVH